MPMNNKNMVRQLFTGLRQPCTALAVAMVAFLPWFAGAMFYIAAACAQQPEATAPVLRFDIQRYQVDGNTLLKPAVIERLVAPYTGKQKDFSDVQRALEALEIAYRDLGYGIVQVILPEQNIASGVVIFSVVEPHIGKVTVEGAVIYDKAN